MYFYSIYGCSDSLILCHSKKFTKEEFDKMCEETPKLIYKSEAYHFSFYNVELISKHLIDNYGFKNIEVIEGFFVDKIK